MDYSMNDLMKDIAVWHKETFDTTFEAQLIKLAEEVKEAHDAKTKEEWHKEMADVVFVLSALIYRYDDMTSKAIYSTMWMVLEENDRRAIKRELIAKFEKNKKRIWVKMPDGTYHHAQGTD